MNTISKNNLPIFNNRLVIDHFGEALNRPWHGKRATSKKHVYLTLCRIAYSHHGFCIHASVRDISIKTGYDISTVSEAINALIDDKLIVRIKRHNKRNEPSLLADEFQLTELIAYVQAHQEEYRNSLDSECSDIGGVEDFGFTNYLEWLCHDLFRYHGLGKSCLDVYNYLASNPEKRAGEIAEATKHAESTVYYNLRKLLREYTDITTGEVYTLAEKTGSKYRIVPCELQKVAEIMGVAGEGSAKREKHDNQRLSRRDWLTRKNPNTPKGHIRSLQTFDDLSLPITNVNTDETGGAEE